jgi:hypothetical protein
MTKIVGKGMRLMTRLFIRKNIVVLTFLALFSVLGSGCGGQSGKPGQEYLNLALAGMAGTDGVTFEGASALLKGRNGTPYESLYYGGKMEKHNQVTLYTLLPDGNSTNAAGADTIKQESASTNKPYYYSQLKKIGDKWEPFNTSDSQEGNPLPRLNPISQLEELEKLDKTVEVEAGGGRGIRVLRIELSPEEAYAQLAAQLNDEMSALRNVGQNAVKSTADTNPNLNKALAAFWKKQDTELRNRLERAQVQAVYHLNIDTRHNLPKRMSLTRTVSFQGDGSETHSETYVTQIDFYGYR